MRVADIQGLSPAVESTRSDKQFVIRGKNYIFDAIGPWTPFGNRFLTQQPLTHTANLAYSQGFRVRLTGGDRVFTITNWAIMEWVESLGNWQVLYSIPDTTSTPFRWTFAYLNGYVYFCHPRTGILSYELATKVFQRAQGEGIPAAAVAIASDNGRLGVMTNQFLYWSSQSDGLDFTPELGGAGAQLISDRVAGDPIMLTSFAKGFFVWTTGGIMRSEFVGDVEVYRHKNISTEYRPLNSFCVIRMSDDTNVILDERGLFQTKGAEPTPLTPLFNEFLIDYLQANNLNLAQNARLEWDDLHRRLYLSVSTTYSSPIYEKAFVLYPPLDKWGEFSERHYGIFPIKIKGSLREDDYFGYADTTNRVRFFKETGSRETVNTSLTVNLWNRAVQKPVEETEGLNGLRIVSSTVQEGYGTEPTPVNQSGYYQSASATITTPELTGLDALIRIGQFRGISDVAPDVLTEITNLMLRSGTTGLYGAALVDYNLEAPEGFDLSTVSAPIDTAFEKLNYTNHKLRIFSTLDGENEFQSAVPTLTAFTPAGRFFALSTVGIWHQVEFSATEVGEAFRVHTAEFTAVEAGRLT